MATWGFPNDFSEPPNLYSQDSKTGLHGTTGSRHSAAKTGGACTETVEMVVPCPTTGTPGLDPIKKRRRIRNLRKSKVERRVACPKIREPRP